MSLETDQRVVLVIDSPGENWETPFHEVRKAEIPEESDPNFIGPLNALIMAHIVVRSPDDGARILADIRHQWENGESAWAKQHLPTSDEVDMQIVGVTVRSEKPDEWVFRIYTPREEYIPN